MPLRASRSSILRKRRLSLWNKHPFSRRRVQLEPLECRTMLTATVATGQIDYSPGETAFISGSGFEIGETIQLQVLHTDGTPNTGEGHEPWYVVDGGDGDLDGIADGNLQTTWYV